MEIGRRVRQPAGYSAFIPNAFPPNSLVLSPETYAALEKANLNLGRLDGITELLPSLDFFISMYVLKESAYSSQIEGTRATMADAIRAESNIRSGLPSDVDNILRHIQAMNDGLRQLQQLPLSLRLIRNVHERLMTGAETDRHVTPGEFRTSQNWIGGTSPATARYVPPPPIEMGRCLGELEAFLHSDDNTPRLIKSGLAHAQFETIHPFLDGNGRTGRLLVTFYLCQQGVLSKPVLYMSAFFRRHRELYFDLLHAYHDKGEIESWLQFFLEGVAEVAENAILTAKKVVKIRERDRDKIALMGRRSEKAMRLLERLYKAPIIKVKNAEEATGYNRANANLLVAKFVEAEIISPVDESAVYDREFIHRDYLALFNSD